MEAKKTRARMRGPRFMKLNEQLLGGGGFANLGADKVTGDDNFDTAILLAA